MTTPILHPVLGILVTLGLALGLPLQPPFRTPNDAAGVGAMGKIGRGTSPGEEFFRPIPIPTPPVFVYSPTPIPVPTRPVTVDVNRARGTAAGSRPRARTADRAGNWLALGRNHPYLGYHRGWVHGYWSAHHADSWRWRPADSAGSETAAGGEPGYLTSGFQGGGMLPRLGPRPGLGRGWGLPAWLVGPMVYTWGYFPYENPFDGGSAAGPGAPPALDYSRPIDILIPPPTEVLVHDALTSFRQARAAFRREDYTRALHLTEEALRLMPDDPMLHQFRALALFALHRYREAAATLYAVLAVVPGWDWTTMTNLYTDPATYTRQLRMLESYCETNPRAAAARFVLAYHYLTTGYFDAAVTQLRGVLALRPEDFLSTQLIRQLRPPQMGSEERAARIATTPPAPAPAAGPAAEPGALQGTWTAHPRQDTTITVTFQERGHLIWRVSERGRRREFEGYCLYEAGTLTLSQDEDNSLVGRVTWPDSHHFSFRSPDKTRAVARFSQLAQRFCQSFSRSWRAGRTIRAWRSRRPREPVVRLAIR